MNPIRPLVLVTGLVLVLSACGGGSGGLGTVPPVSPTPEPSVVPGSPDVTPGPTTGPSPSAPASPGATPGATPSPQPTPAGKTIVRAYFYLGGEQGSEGLVGVLREVPATRAVATAAIEALLDGPTPGEANGGPISSAIPAGSQLLGLSIKDGVATIDLSSEFESGGGSLSTMVRLGQVVFTLTQFPSVESVRFMIEGEIQDVFGSEGIVLDRPVGRDDYEEILPAIFVDRPVYGAAIGNPARITGTSNVFEATSLVAILDGDGRVIAESMVMATCGTGCRGTFDVTLQYDLPAAEWGTLRVWAGSAVDGSPIHVRDYPVWLTPAD